MIIFILIFIFSVKYINLNKGWNGLIIEISIGFLAFISIFYPLIIRREITKKREEMLVRKWKEYLPKFKEDIKELKEESDKDNPKYQIMLQISEKIQEKLNDMTLLEFEININKQVIRGIFGFIIGIILFFLDTIGEFFMRDESGNFYLRFLAYGVFLYSIYKIIELLITWVRITSEN